MAIGIQTNHQSCGDDRRNDTEQHNQTPVVNLVAEPAGEENDEYTDRAGREVKDKRLLARVAECCQKDRTEVAETKVVVHS